MMLDGASRFYRFYLQVREAVGMDLEYRSLSPGVYVIHDEQLGVHIICYLLTADERKTTGNPDKREIHIDEDYWMNRPHVVLSRIAALAGRAVRVHARDTVIARIDKKMSMSFLHEHHLNVALPGKYRYGLFLNGELVAVAVFSGGRRMRDKPEGYRSFELLRFCHKRGAHVVGGLSKLMGGFRRDFNPGDIMTYADKDWTDGKRYEKIGFEVVGETAPQGFWVDPATWNRYSSENLPATLHGMTDEELRQVGYIQVRNSGSLKLVKRY